MSRFTNYLNFYPKNNFFASKIQSFVKFKKKNLVDFWRENSNILKITPARFARNISK